MDYVLNFTGSEGQPAKKATNLVVRQQHDRHAQVPKIYRFKAQELDTFMTGDLTGDSISIAIEILITVGSRFNMIKRRTTL